MPEEWPPLVILDEAVDRAQDHVTPSDPDPHVRNITQGLLAWARRTVHVAKELRFDSEPSALHLGEVTIQLSQSELEKVVDSDLLSPYVDCALLEEGRDLINQARRRISELIPLLVNNPLNPFAGRYLERVAMLYIWGLDVEVHVMCRSVLDALFQELIPAEHAAAILPRRKPAHLVSLHDRLCIARFTEPQLLSNEAWHVAFNLKEDGNDVLHKDIDHALHYAHPLEAIRRLRSILESIPPSETSIRLNPVPAGHDCNCPKAGGT